MDHITDAYKGILALGLEHNIQELEQGIHVVQSFVTQHMLQRLAPESWGHWYKKSE